MTTKPTNSVLNLVEPPIDKLVLEAGTFDNVVTGSSVAQRGYFTAITDTSLAPPLVGAPAGLLTGVFLGTGLAMSGHVLYCTLSPPPPATGYGLGLYGKGNFGP